MYTTGMVSSGHKFWPGVKKMKSHRVFNSNGKKKMLITITFYHVGIITFSVEVTTVSVTKLVV